MEYIERRKKDDEDSRKVSNVVDKYVYSSDTFSDTGRTWDYKTQISGVDAWFSTSAFTYQCDEKCSVYWMNKNLETFALELSAYSPKKNHRYPGWFMQKSKCDSYAFIYINKCDGTIDDFQEKDIKEIEYILVRKSALVNYLNCIGYTYDRLKEINYDLVYNQARMEKYKDKDYNIRFTYMPWKFKEKAVNLLIPRETLRFLSDYNAVITTTHDKG